MSRSSGTSKGRISECELVLTVRRQQKCEEAVGVDRQHYRLTHGLPQNMKDHPQEGQTRDAVASLGWVRKKGHEPYDQTEKKSSRPRHITGTAENDAVVEDDRIPAQDLGEKAVAKIVKELGDDDAEGRAENRGGHKCRPDSYHQLGRRNLFC